MLPDRVSNPGPLTYESDAPPIALRGPAKLYIIFMFTTTNVSTYRLEAKKRNLRN